ncbi:MAG: hypothetical protein ETSY2_20175 [Candidatus Entotheonella gemina]|uniref:DUF928 domain-containing protein n=1 Tax=Candidatus Entotheonella gemina TaxID=1429439 RepID=W4M6X8_9BACT|nr:MAG: hypothetical protein ETSY2_20175 [Candidatus Entotheonella gemina]
MIRRDIDVRVLIVGLLLAMCPDVLLAQPHERASHPSKQGTQLMAATPDDVPGSVKKASRAEAQVQTQQSRIYMPPQDRRPGGRLGVVTRGDGCANQSGQPEEQKLTLLALVPDHVGLTTHEQPSLYWYLSIQTICPAELTVTDDHTIKPLLETRLDAPVQPGIQQVRLADYGVSLKPDVPYRWFVTLIVDEESLSKNVVAGGIVERIVLSDQLRGQLLRADKQDIPFLYASAGVWYDAFATLSELIEMTPENLELRQKRARLLEEVGLSHVDSNSN